MKNTINTLTQKLGSYYQNPSVSDIQINQFKLEQLRIEVIKARNHNKQQGKKLSPNSLVVKNYKAALPPVLLVFL